MSNEQDMRKMGGLKKYLPITFWTFFIATFAITGIPGLAGFFSKDEILWKSFSSSHGHPALWVVGFAAAGLTAFYMFRLIYLTFYGKERMDDETRHHIHESPADDDDSADSPGRAFGDRRGMSACRTSSAQQTTSRKWLHPVMAGGSHHEAIQHALASGGADTSMEWLLMFLSVALVGASIFVAYYFYRKNTGAATSLAEKFAGVKKTLLNKYYVDELYGAVVVRPDGLFCAVPLEDIRCRHNRRPDQRCGDGRP